jgi:hypothetical protein
MAHYAYVVDGVVREVHVVSNDVITDEDGVEQAELGAAFLGQLHGCDPANLIQCSYNGNFRGNYPGAGWLYNSNLDAFTPTKPFPSWVLNEETFLWDSPVPYPADSGLYSWDEQAGAWVEA